MSKMGPGPTLKHILVRDILIVACLRYHMSKMGPGPTLKYGLVQDILL